MKKCPVEGNGVSFLTGWLSPEIYDRKNMASANQCIEGYIMCREHQISKTWSLYYNPKALGGYYFFNVFAWEIVICERQKILNSPTQFSFL